MDLFVIRLKTGSKLNLTPNFLLFGTPYIIAYIFQMNFTSYIFLVLIDEIVSNNDIDSDSLIYQVIDRLLR